MSTRLNQRRIAKTANYTILPPMDSAGTVFTNRGAVGPVTFTLPSPLDGFHLPMLGMWYEFRCVADQTLTVAAKTNGDIISAGNGASNSVGFQTPGLRVGRGLRVFCDGTNWHAFQLGNVDGLAINGVDVNPVVTMGNFAETVVADANATVTAAQLLGGFLRSVPTAARTWTLDTGANLDAAIPNVRNGMSFDVTIFNNSAGAFAIGLTAGAGETFFPAAGISIAQNKTGYLTFLRTGVATWNVYQAVSA